MTDQIRREEKGAEIQGVGSLFPRFVVCISLLALSCAAEARTIAVEAGQSIDLADDLFGNEELVKTGPGTLVLTGNNSGWTGAIDVQEGTLKSTFAKLGKTGDLRVRSNGALMLTGTDPIVDKPTRPLYLSGAVRSDGFSHYGTDAAKFNSYWYPFVDVTLEGNSHMDTLSLVGWGKLHMNGFRLDVDGSSGDVNFTQVEIDGEGVISKTGGYVIFTSIKSDFGEGLALEIANGCTVKLVSCAGVKCHCPIKVPANSTKCWIMSAGGINKRTDNIWAGPIEIGEGSLLMGWASTGDNDLCVIEGPISGEGSFSGANDSGRLTLFRGGATITTTAPLLVDKADILIEDASVLPISGGVKIQDKGNLKLIGCTEDQIQTVLENTVMAAGSVSGRIVIVVPDGENLVYNGPFDATKLIRNQDGGSVSSTAPITADLLNGIKSINRGLWSVGGDTSATISLGNWYYSGFPFCFSNAGAVNFSGWIASEVSGVGNTNPAHLRFEGDTTVTVGGGIYVGRGGENGIGKMEIRDGASVSGRWLIGYFKRDRGGVCLSGGRMMMEGLDKSATYNAIGYSDPKGGASASSGCIIQRGGTNTINAKVLGSYGPHTYGAYIIHDGVVVQKPTAEMGLACGGRFHFYMDGGTYTNENTQTGGSYGYPFSLNVSGVDTGYREGSFTLEGEATFTSNSRIDTWAKNSVTRYNLNGGVLTCPLLYVFDDIHNNYGVVHLSFDGGTWRVVPHNGEQVFGYSNDNAGPSTFVIYEGGATIDTCGASRRTDRSIDAPTGLGVKAVTLPEKIGGIAVSDWRAVGPLQFWFEGGNGSADAIVDFDERTSEIKGVKILCSGFGYTEAPKAYVVAPDGLSTNECTVEMCEPKGGGLTKKGLGSLCLNRPNTYTGRTVVEEGELKFLDASCVPPAPDVTIAAGADFRPPSGIVLDTLRGNGVSWYDQSVTNCLFVNYADVVAGAHLQVKQGVLNLAGAKIVVSDLADLPENAKSVTIAEAENGITGTFSLVADETLAKCWRVQKVGNRLRLIGNRGMIIIFR